MCNVCNTGSRQNTCYPCCCYNLWGSWLSSLFSDTQYVCRDACGNVRCGNTTASTSNTDYTGYGCYSTASTHNHGCGCGCGFGCGRGFGCGYNTVAQTNTGTQGYGCCRCRHYCND